MDSAFFSYTPRFGDSSDWGVIAIALTMPDHVLSWMVGNAEVMLPLTRFDRRYRCSIVRIGGSDGTRTRDLLRDRQLNYAPQGMSISLLLCFRYPSIPSRVVRFPSLPSGRAVTEPSQS